MATVYSSVVSGSYWRTYITYSVSSTNSTYTVKVDSAGVNAYTGWVQYPFTATLSATGQTSVTKSIASTKIEKGTSKAIISNQTFSWARGTSAASKTVSLRVNNTYNGTSSTVSFSVTVPARPTFTITYNSNGGTGTMANTTYQYNTSGTTTLRPNAFTRTGYHFKYWNLKADGSGTYNYADGRTWGLNNAANYTLYAIWEKNTLTLKYYMGSQGSVTDSTYNSSPMYSKAYSYGSAAFNLVNHSTFTLYRTGYHARPNQEWFRQVRQEDDTVTNIFYDQNVDYNISDFADIKTSSQNIALYPAWSIDTYTITYNANGGTRAPSTQTKEYNTPLTLSSDSPVRTNYNFLGWSTSQNATRIDYESGATYKANTSVTLYAVWQLNVVNVTTFRYSSPTSSYANNNYLAVSESIPTNTYTEIIAPDIPDNFGFIGWSEEKPNRIYPYSTTRKDIRLFGDSTKTYWALYKDITPTLYKSTYSEVIRVSSNSSINSYIEAVNKNTDFSGTTTEATTTLFGYIEFPYSVSIINNKIIRIEGIETYNLTTSYVNNNNKLFFKIVYNNDSSFNPGTIYTITFSGRDDLSKPISETIVLKKRSVLVDIQPGNTKILMGNMTDSTFNHSGTLIISGSPYVDENDRGEIRAQFYKVGNVNVDSETDNSAFSLVENGSGNQGIYSDKKKHWLIVNVNSNDSTRIYGGTVELWPNNSSSNRTLFNADGTVTLSAAPTANMHAVTKQYVDEGHQYMHSSTSILDGFKTENATFTPSYDGFVVMGIRTSTTNTNGSIFVKDISSTTAGRYVLMLTQPLSEGYLSGSFPVKKNFNYKITGLNNASVQFAYVYYFSV